MEKNNKKKYPRYTPRSLYDLIYYETLRRHNGLPVTVGQLAKLGKGGNR